MLRQQGKLAQALACFERATAIIEQALGPAHPDLGLSFDNMGLVLYDQGKLAQAQSYHERALAIRE